MGPTSANVQPARFVFCLSQDSREKLASVASEANAAKIRKAPAAVVVGMDRSEEHTSELQSLMRISYAVFCLKKKKQAHITTTREPYKAAPSPRIHNEQY